MEKALFSTSGSLALTFSDLKESQSFISSGDIGLWLELLEITWEIVHVMWTSLLELRKVKIPWSLASTVPMSDLWLISTVLNQEDFGDLIGIIEINRDLTQGWD